MSGRTFSSAGRGYTDFVRGLRGGPMHAYDYVSGPVLSNPRAFYAGKPAAAFGNQISFHTPRAVDFLQRGIR
jgi:hypothetical protein